MAESQDSGMPPGRGFWTALMVTYSRFREFLGEHLHFLIVPFLVTSDSIRVILWHVSSAVQRHLLRQKRIRLGPCCDTAVAHVKVGAESVPLCPFALKYRGLLAIQTLCSNSGVVPGASGERTCVCAKDSFMPALPRWALGGFALVAMWIALIGVAGWGAWQSRSLFGLQSPGPLRHLPVVDAGKSSNISDSERGKAREYVRGAGKYLENKRYSAARVEYRNAIQKDPLLMEAYTGLAECCLKLGLFGEAKEALGKVLSLDPSSPVAYRRLTELAGKQRDFKQAIVHARKLCDLQPSDKDARLLLSSCYSAVGDATNALSEVSLAMSLAPNDPDPYVVAARIEALQQHVDLAETHFLRAIQVCPTNAAARIGLAGIYLGRGKTEDAVKSLNSVLSDAPANVDAILSLGRLYCAMGKPDGAIALYRKKAAMNPQLLVVRAELAGLLMSTGRISEGYDAAMKLNEADPGNVSSALVLSDMFLNQGILTLAEDYARKALRSNPNIIEGHRLLTRIFMKRGEIDKALNYLRRISPMLPDDFETQLRLAICLEMKGETDKAEQRLKTLTMRAPESPLPHLHLGELYARHKQTDKAIACFRRAVARKPENEDALNNLATVLLDSAKDDKSVLDEATQYAARAWELAPGNPAIADTLGWAHCRKANYDEALTILSFAAKKAASSPEVRYHIACALRGKGQSAKAREQLEAALSLSTDFPGAEAAKALLDELKR